MGCGPKGRGFNSLQGHIMFTLDTPVEKLPFVGSKNLPRLNKLGIKTIKDLLWHFPHRYEDYRRQVPAEEIREPGEMISLQGEIIKITTTSLWRRRSVTEAFIQDHSGVVRAVWFNQPYLETSLPLETRVCLSGKTSLDKHGLYLSNPSYEKLFFTSNQKLATSDQVHTGRLVPIYPETEGITSKYLRFLLKPLLPAMTGIADPLPEHVLKKHNFPSLETAVKSIHFPDSPEEAETARERMAFEELFLFQLRSIANRRQNLRQKAPVIKFEPEAVKALVESLPFELTGDQKVAAFEILKDLEKKYPMNRLLNGDVGSGKTVVALVAAYQTIRHQKQVVFMAPTEILAQQHFQTITSLLGNAKYQTTGKSVIPPTLDPRLVAREFSSGSMTDFPNLKIGLLTGSEARFSYKDTEKKISKKLMQSKIASGEIDILIGTHAVIQKDIKFKNLALVILDEQHRFGVVQRAALLRSSGASADAKALADRSEGQALSSTIPHLLSMTATPIPRTLALTIYGDLDISLIKEKPKNRKKIITKVMAKNREEQAYQFLEKEVRAGRQIFVVCPRIELSDPKEIIKTKHPQNKMNVLWAEVKAVTAEYEKLSQKIFPQFKIAMLHGKMPARSGRGLASGGKPSKEQVMKDFKDGKIDILVSTSVVEVGVDIPNASVMLIENAERFGLAQLHQFRGRVGRAEHQSHCLLVNGGNSFENKRLKALENCDDGFKLAEEDLKQRGPGEFTGQKQSGMPDLAMASLTNLELIKKARLEAKLLLKENPSLSSYPLLKTQLAKFQKIRHFE
ncbi:MAG: ATP-dependent DNA helicase RecG [Parcubacteria group bacterium Gr01-1014_44]|nr:MAG: ATP-dependent DNA helicase RecG [Parcubacteria group bacterium Gr01-1014_44]